MNVRPGKKLGLILSALAIGGALLTTPVWRSQASVRPGPPRFPDLTITAVEKVYYSTTSGRRGALIPDRVRIQVSNIGNAAAGSFEDQFEWDAGWGNEQEYIFFINGLGAGQSAWVEVSSNGYNLWQAGHQFRYTTDCTNSVVESNENNNVYNGP